MGALLYGLCPIRNADHASSDRIIRLNRTLIAVLRKPRSFGLAKVTRSLLIGRFLLKS